FNTWAAASINKEMSQPPRQPQDQQQQQQQPQSEQLLMPAKTASTRKSSLQPLPLHFGRSVNDLNRRAAYTVHAVGSAAVGMKLLGNLFSAAEKYFHVERDEERAYVLYMRMLLVHNRISGMPNFNKAVPSKYDEELMQARTQVETLAERLNSRYKTSRTIDELRGFESLTRHFAIADREQPTGLGGGGGGGGGSGSSVATAETSATPSHQRRLLGIEATAARRLLTLPTLDRSGGSGAAIVFDLRPAAEKAVCRLKHDRLVCLDGRDFAPGCSLEQVERLVPREQLATWRAAIASPPPQDLVLLLVLAWHRGASERLARDPGSCAAALCSVLSEAAKSSSTSSGQVPQPFRYLVSGLQGLAAVHPAIVTDPSYAGPAEDASVSGPIDESLDDSSEPLVAVLSLEGGGGGRAKSETVRVKDAPRDPRPQTGQSLSQILANHSAVINSFDQETLDQLSPNRLSTSPGLTGLRNLGNSCYANCVLQCLSNTVLLATHFLAQPPEPPANEGSAASSKSADSDAVLDDADSRKARQLNIAASFSKLCRALWCGAFASVSPAGILTAVGRYAAGSTFEGGQEQQDAQEFLLFLLDGMHEDFNRRSTGKAFESSSASLEVNSVESTAPGQQQHQEDLEASLAWRAHRQTNDSIFVDLFQGQLKSTLTCQHCQHSSVTYEAFMYCSVPVVDNFDCSLNDCLEAFLQPEQLTGACQWLCPACDSRRDATKQLDVWRLPPCLLVHLKRFRGYDGGKKISSLVKFPVAGLDLDRFCRNQALKSNRRVYNLYGVCNHYGRADCGHYTAACLNAPTNQWHCFDDDQVSKIEPDNVVSAAAYILFYRQQS
ncbi:hypothetical protein BOX15_Mlig023841g1, partial [Macrostomum lignano]